MGNIENSEGLFRGVGEVESFKISLGAKLMDVLKYNCGTCHLQALLGEAITGESSKNREALISSIKKSLDESDNRPIIHRDKVRFLVNEALRDNFGETEASTGLPADEMADLGLLLPDADYSGNGHGLSDEEELRF